MNRNIQDVIAAIREALPADCAVWHERLNWIQRDAAYRPPEGMGASWKNLAALVEEFADPEFNPPQSDSWQMAVVCPDGQDSR